MPWLLLGYMIQNQAARSVVVLQHWFCVRMLFASSGWVTPQPISQRSDSEQSTTNVSKEVAYKPPQPMLASLEVVDARGIAMTENANRI